MKSISRKNCAEILKQGREFLEQVLSVYEFALIDYKSWLTTQVSIYTFEVSELNYVIM